MSKPKRGANAGSSGHIVLKAETGHINFSAPAFRKWAGHYLGCARSFVAPGGFSPVPYFLLCRAIELDLKGRLLEFRSRKEVKEKFHHDLAKAYKALPASDHVLNAAETNLLELATDLYKRDMAFSYPTAYDAATAYSRWPELKALEQLTHKLLGVASASKAALGR